MLYQVLALNLALVSNLVMESNFLINFNLFLISLQIYIIGCYYVVQLIII